MQLWTIVSTFCNDKNQFQPNEPSLGEYNMCILATFTLGCDYNLACLREPKKVANTQRMTSWSNCLASTMIIILYMSLLILVHFKVAWFIGMIINLYAMHRTDIDHHSNTVICMDPNKFLLAVATLLSFRWAFICEPLIHEVFPLQSPTELRL